MSTVKVSEEKKKYVITDMKKRVSGRTLYRIKCVSAFVDVKEGDLGGWVETPENLSQNGTAWLYDDSKAFGKSRVMDNAVLRGNACVSHYAWVCDNSEILENARVYGHAELCDHVTVKGNCKVYGDARLKDKVVVSGNAHVYENSIAYGKAVIGGNEVHKGNDVIFA